MWGAGVGGAAAFSQAAGSLRLGGRTDRSLRRAGAALHLCPEGPGAHSGSLGLEAPPRVPVGRSRFLHPYFQGVLSFLVLWFIHSLASASYVPGSEVGIGDTYPQSKTQGTQDLIGVLRLVGGDGGPRKVKASDVKDNSVPRGVDVFQRFPSL